MSGNGTPTYVITERFEQLASDYGETRLIAQNLRTEVKTGFATLSTQLTFYQTQLTDVQARVSKLESFKSIMMAGVMVSGLIGGVIGIVIEKFVL